MLSWSYKGGFFGNYLCMGELPQSHRAGVNATPALNRQGGNVLVAAFYAVEIHLPK